jgi:hypothetical protein
MKKINIFIYLLVALFVSTLIGCETENSINQVEEQSPSQLLKVGRTSVWADDLLYSSVVTPAKFKPESDPFDQLYAASFKDGIGLISESKPGDHDYNGGRWHLNVLKDDVMTDYSNASSVEDLNLDDFKDGEMYFECPLLPRKNR